MINELMRIVWIVNIAMADACVALGKPAPVIGGWLTGYRDALLSVHPEVELHIVEPYWGASPKEITTRWEAEDNRSAVITHHLFPDSWLATEMQQADPMRSRLSAISNRLLAHFAELSAEIQPDVVHLHGTELPHALAWIEANGTEHTLASIQGLACECAKVYMSGLTPKQQRRSLSDWRHGFSLAKEQAKLAERGTTEVALLRQIEHVAGRTQWDHDSALAINGNLRYHTLQEVLRQDFYDYAGTWSYDRSQPHTLFLSQSHYPLKGLHQILTALPMVLERYPDTQVRIVGRDITTKHWWQRSTYGNVLHELIERHNLRPHLTFLGALSAQQMVHEYQQAQIFVCPSRLENSNNSVCEAQLIGTPTIASRVGGLTSLVEHNHSGLLYDFANVQALADCICSLFSNADLCRQVSKEASRVALLRHDREIIASTLYNIYKEL